MSQTDPVKTRREVYRIVPPGRVFPKGKKNRKAFRKCEVTGAETVKAGDKHYPTYRVECSEHNGKRVYNYAPEVRTSVRMVRNHKKNGTTTV